MLSRIWLLGLVGLFGFWASLSIAQTKLSPIQEERARDLFLELRCVVCQNQSIGDSDADVAKDLREIVREQISADKSNAEIKSYLVERYGEFILLRPVLALHTIILWAAPILLLIVGGALAWRTTMRRPVDEVTGQLSMAEEEQIIEIMKKTSGESDRSS